jgi:hypothetical protein
LTAAAGRPQRGPLVADDGLAHRPKVFVIGHNKTGTTSVEAALASFGYLMGDQVAAELLLDDWAQRHFGRLFELCRTADAFQDVPFSLWDTYRALDQAFPGSKFVLTVRNSSEEWYDSVVRWGRKLVGAQGSVPTAEEMRSFDYRAPGWFLRSHLLIYGVDEAHVYDRTRYVAAYERHNEAVLDYFSGRADSFLVLNVSNAGALHSLGAFLGIVVDPGVTMPHLNRT